ncbi:MAG: hypothetical protein J2P54_10310, partial [Bradyrhizobiaceae bacterium]|nr:hypothetical protein [Bradyrhizobiaceae bacterium]
MYQALEVLGQVETFILREHLWGPIGALAGTMAFVGFWIGRRVRRLDIASFASEEMGPSARELLLQRQLDEVRAREVGDIKLRDAIL